MGHFIADFCCQDRRLIIELDGVHHDEQQSKDEWRSRKLEAWGGYRVMRFRNEDVIENIERTLEDIWDALNIPEEPPGKSSPLLQPDDHRVVKKTDA